MDSSFTIMNPQHSVENAYTEWVVKAIEIIAQSRSPSIPFSTDCLVSRQFALVVSERFRARSKVLTDANVFFHDRLQIVIDVRPVESTFTSERWKISFDSAKDVIPTIRRSERRDLTLPRRLAIALRCLLSLVRLIKPDPTLSYEVSVREEKEFDTPTLSTGNDGLFVRTDIVSIPSSFGSLHLKLFTKEGIHMSAATTRTNTPFVTPSKPRFSHPIKLDENFVMSQTSGLSRPHSLGTIEMVIEVEPSSASRPAVSRSVPLSKSPPRELSEIWPTSSLSYPVSPGRERKASFDSSEGGKCVVIIPEIFPKKDTADLPHIKCIFERPVPVAAITDTIDQIKRMRAKLFIHR